jgi:hypothetical protein
MQRAVCWAGILFLLSSSHVIGATGRASTRILPVIRQGHGKPLYGSEKRDYSSPDRKYIARVQHVEGDTWDLALLDAKSHKTLVKADDVQSLVWAPHSPHRLVAATACIYGEAMLAMWEGGHRWRSLHPVRRAYGEMFILYGVADNGRFIIYGHTPDIDKSYEAINRRRRLRLPSPAGSMTPTPAGPKGEE